MKTHAGMPPVANETISSAVKSGRLNSSTSKSAPQGRSLMSSGARSTSFSYLAESSLLTIAVNPSHSARAPQGSTSEFVENQLD